MSEENGWQQHTRMAQVARCTKHSRTDSASPQVAPAGFCCRGPLKGEITTPRFPTPYGISTDTIIDTPEDLNTGRGIDGNSRCQAQIRD